MEGTQLFDTKGLADFLGVDTPIEETPKQEEPIKTVDDLFNKEEEKPEEIKVEETEPIKQEQRQEEVQAPKGSDYSELVKSLVEKGDWGDYTIKRTNDQGEEEEVDIVNLEHIDKELFFQLKEAQEADKKEEFEKNYISKDGIDEYTEKLIEISKQGGDLTQLIQTQATLINPVLKIKENRDEKSLIDLVAFKMQSQGYESDYINMKITKLLKDGVLDEEADKVINEIEANYNNHLEATKQQLKQQRDQVEKDRTEYRKTLSNKITSFNLKEHDKRKTLDVASRYDENGISEAEKLFYKIKQEDPERYLEVVMLLSDKEMFESVKYTKAKNQAIVDTTKKVLSIKPKTNTTEKTPEKKEDPFEQLFKTTQKL